MRVKEINCAWSKRELHVIPSKRARCSNVFAEDGQCARAPAERSPCAILRTANLVSQDKQDPQKG